MNYRLSTILLATALLVVLGVSSIQAAPAETVKQTAPAGDYDFTNHGTAWVAENRNQFAVFNPKGWGTATRAKAAGSYWMHIPIPFPSYMAGSAMYVKYVEFCAKTSNWAAVYPIHWDLYDGNGNNFYSENISWALNNSFFCWGHTFSTPTFRQDLGISVLVTYQNTTDSLTLYKAWVKVTP
jgi:hypothetical protein